MTVVEESFGADPFGVFRPRPDMSDAVAGAGLAAALATPMGPQRIAGLAAVDAAGLNGHDLVDYMAGWAGCASWAGARAELALAQVAGPQPVPDPDAYDPTSKPSGNITQDGACATVGAALGVSPYAAMNRIADARSAATVLAPVTGRVLAGTWTRSHLWYAGKAVTGHRSVLAAAAVQAACAQQGADQWTPARLGRRINIELVRLDSKAVSKRTRARRHERGARLDPEDDLRGRISVEGSWETMSWAFRQFRRWAETERDRLRAIRKTDPSARFCCPQAMARLLAHATPDTNGTEGGGEGTRAGGLDWHRGAGASGPHGCGQPIPGVDPHYGSDHPEPGHSTEIPGGTDRIPAPDTGTAGDSTGPKGPAGKPLRPTDECPFCGQADSGIPSLSALTADAVIAAAGLLATQLGTSTGTPGHPAGSPVGKPAGSPAGDITADLVPARGKRWRYAAVVIDLPTMVGLADNPGHVPGYGPVPAAIARELAANAPAWRRFLTDTTGVLLDTGADTYRPGDRLREHVTARDWTCTFPGCGRTAADADLDHITPFNGTNTLASNLHPLCRTHHRVKTHTGWTPTRRPDGITVWTSPDGHTYTSQPDTPWSHPNRTGTAGTDPGPAGNLTTHWTPTPASAAEHRLATLLADPCTPPARAP